MRRTELVLQGFDERPRDYSMQLDCLDLMGRAMLAAGEPDLAQRYWERYLATPRPPIAGPTGHYHLGECRWRLNDPAGARTGVSPRRSHWNRFSACKARPGAVTRILKGCREGKWLSTIETSCSQNQGAA